MAAPAINDHISELAALLKTVYHDSVEQQQNLAAMLWKRFGDADVTMGGNAYEFPARMVNTQSVGARGYRVGLPEPVMNIDVTARVRHKFMYGTFDIAGPDIEKGKGNPNAFVNTLTDKMRSLTEMVGKDLNMQCYLDGTGVRATISGVSGTSLAVDQVKYLRVGMHVNVIASDGVTLRAGGDSDTGDSAGTYNARRFTVLSITPGASPAVVLAAAGVAAAPTSVAADDMIVRHKAVGSELTGMAALIDDGVNNTGANILQDIDRTASTAWRAKVLDTSGGDITLQLMQTAMDIPEMASGRRIDQVLGSHNGRDRYLQLLVPQKRFTDLKLDGGFTTLEYNGRDFLVDVDCQDDTIYFNCKETIKKFGLFNLQFVDQTGGILKHDSLTSGDVLYGYMRAICNLGILQCNANAKIVGLPVEDAYVI